MKHVSAILILVLLLVKLFVNVPRSEARELPHVDPAGVPETAPVVPNIEDVFFF